MPYQFPTTTSTAALYYFRALYQVAVSEPQSLPSTNDGIREHVKCGIAKRSLVSLVECKVSTV